MHQHAALTAGTQTPSLDDLITHVLRQRRLRWNTKLAMRRRCHACQAAPSAWTLPTLVNAVGRSRVQWEQVQGELINGGHASMYTGPVAHLLRQGQRTVLDQLHNRALARGLEAPAHAGTPVAAPPPLPPTNWQLGIGVNGMKLYQLEDTRHLDEDERTTKFGDAPSQWRDTASLRITQVRQFGPRDLRWDLLTAWDDINRRVPLPVGRSALGDLVQWGYPVPDSHTGLPTNVRRFAELLVDAWDAGGREGAKVRFTFLTLGGGTDRTLESADDSAVDALGVLPTTVFAPFAEPDYPEGIRQRAMLRMYWHPDHLARAFDDPDALTEAERRFWLASLDLQDAYKMEYIRLLADACAQLLLQAERAIVGGFIRDTGEFVRQEDFSLNLIVDGIEIFNEVEIRNIFFTDADGGATRVWQPEESGAEWGAAWALAAFAFARNFVRSRGGRPSSPAPQLFLPGIASYGEFDDTANPKGQTWPYKMQFLEALIPTAREGWRILSGFYPPEETLPRFDDAVSGVDYHWYHHAAPGGGDPVGVLNAGWLVSEVQELAHVLESAGVSGRITVYETGVTALADPPTGHAPYIPAGVDARDFQAADVWRRLLAARAGGAEQVGWHAWMSVGGNFAGFGLRTDTEPSDQPAKDSTARSAYFAFHRLAWFLSDAEVRLVLPAGIELRSSYALTRPADGGISGAGVFSGALVFEAVGATMGTIRGRNLEDHIYAYIFLADPTDAAATLTRTVRSAGGGDPDAVVIEPFAPIPDDWVLPAPVPDETTLPTYDLWESITDPVPLAIGTGGTVMEARPGHPPLLILSRGPLEWS